MNEGVNPPRVIAAEVRTTTNSDRLYVVPRPPVDRFTLAGELRRLVGAARIDDEGVAVAARATPGLLHPPSHLTLLWTEDARRFAENRERAREHHSAIREAVRSVKAGGVAVARAMLPDLDDSEVLDDHQLVNVAAMTLPGGPGLCVFDEQGAGKTVTLIFAFDMLVKRREADLLIVLAPKSMVAEWPRDFVRFKGDLYRVQTLSGGRREKLAALRRGGDVLVTNFETAIALEDELAALLHARDGRGVLAVDESFYVKNLNAKRTKAIRRLREWCDRAYVLCGTPAPNSAHDLIQQFSIVDFGTTFDSVDVPDDREAARAVVQQAVDARGLFVRHLKQDVLPDLPPKRFEQVLVPLQPEQQKLYDAALNSLVRDLRTIDDATFDREITSFLARRMSLLQVCSNPAMVVSGYVETPAKLLALDAILEDLIERRGEKVIVWSYFRIAINAIIERYAHYGVVRYDGSVEAVADRREAVRRFQEDDTTRLFVANPAAAGAGLTLHRGRVAVYESMSNQAAHYLQSLDRIHRRGQKRDVEYLILLCDATIEIAEYERLVAKERAAQKLLGDDVAAPVTRRSMLAELTSSMSQ